MSLEKLRKTCYKIMSNFYPKWTNHINKNPSEQEFINSFITVYKCHPYHCIIEREYHGLSILTPFGCYSDGSYIDNYTDTPKLSDRSYFYSGCGCTWDIDDEGKRFYLLDKRTRKPFNFEEIKNKRIIFYYLKNNTNKKSIDDDYEINF